MAGQGGEGAVQQSIGSRMLAFAACMRSHGVPDFPDPSGNGAVDLSGTGIHPSSPAMIAAGAKCDKLLPGGGPPGPGSVTHPSEAELAHMVKIAACMRRHGIVDFPDPRTSVPVDTRGVQVISDIDGVILIFSTALDLQSPSFAKAAAACGFPLHNH